MDDFDRSNADRYDIAPGDVSPERESGPSARIYWTGFLLSVGLTLASFATVNSSVVWAPGIPMLLVVLAVAQMGVHLVFFLHIGTGPDSTNNILALAFGILMVGLLLGGSLWIMSNMHSRLMPHRQESHSAVEKEARAVIVASLPAMDAQRST